MSGFFLSSSNNTFVEPVGVRFPCSHCFTEILLMKSSYNTIFKSNFQYSGTDKPTVDNIITPGGFSLPVNVAAVSADKITASLLALNTGSVFSAE